MSKRFLMGVAVAGLAAFAMGAAVVPRYIQELRVGGGYGDTDGGLYIDAQGNVTSDGTGAFDGGLTGSFPAAGVTGELADAQVSNTITVGSAGDVDDGALSANVSLLGSAIDLSGAEVTGDLPLTGIAQGGATDAQVMTWDTTNGWQPEATGTGDVVGPASATDNAFAIFDGTTGKLLKNGTGTVALVGRLDENETVSGNWDFSANPMADAEVSDTISVGAGGTVNDAALSATVSKLGSSIASSEITDGTITLADTAITGTPTGSLFVRDDWTLATPAGGGDVTGPASSVDGNLAGYTGTSGTVLYDTGIAAANLADLSAAEAIAGNWVNTANPWADNEVADTLTLGAASTVADGALSANVSLLGAAIDSSEITDGEIVNADISATAAIVRTKIAVKTPIVLMAGALKPATTGGCAEAAWLATDEWGAAFDTTEIGCWSFIMPSDFDGSIENIVISYSQATTAGEVTFAYATKSAADDAARSWSGYTNFGADTAGTADRTNYYAPTAADCLDGIAAGTQGEFALKCTYASGGAVTIYGIKMEY